MLATAFQNKKRICFLYSKFEIPLKFITYIKNLIINKKKIYFSYILKKENKISTVFEKPLKCHHKTTIEMANFC